jgi:acetyltransferase-like isoleucine patch superfamily enzyme
MLSPSDRAPQLLVGEGVEIAEGVEIGGTVVIHAGTVIGRDCTIQDLAVIGKPSKLGVRSAAPRDPVGPATLGDGAAVLAGAVVFAGAEIGPKALIGDQAHVRERARIGAESMIGRGSAVDNDVIVGARVKVESNCYLTANSLLEDDVFVGPGVVLTNDNSMGRHPREEKPQGPVLRRACRIGGGAVICPGLEVGEEAFVGAGAVVVEDVPPRAVVVGVPARVLREVPAEDLLERWR